MIKLTLKERYDLRRYSGALICTLSLRYAIDAFQQQLDFTSEEMEQYDIKIDPVTYDFTTNDSDYTVEYSEFPVAVIDSMKSYIKLFDHEATKSNQMLQSTFAIFKKVI